MGPPDRLLLTLLPRPRFVERPLLPLALAFEEPEERLGVAIR